MTNVQITSYKSNNKQCAKLPVINDTNTGDCFKREVTLDHIDQLSLPSMVSSHTTVSHAEIHVIELPTKVWRPKALNKYVQIDYSNDIDEGNFDYFHYGKTVFRPKLKCTDRPKYDLITFDTKKNTAELEKGLRIGKLVLLSITRTVKDLVMIYWDCFCAEGAKRTILDYVFGIDTGASPPICCRKLTYGPHEKTNKYVTNIFAIRQ